MIYIKIHWQLPYDTRESYYFRYFSTKKDMDNWLSKWKPKEPHIQYVCERGITWWVNGVLCQTRFPYFKREIESRDSGQYYFAETIYHDTKVIAYFDSKDTFDAYMENPSFDVISNGSCWFHNGQLMPAVEFK